MTHTVLSEIELRRYSRQIKLSEIGIDGQLRLKQAKVLVIGAGGLGTPVLQYLAAAGVGTLGICDSDYVNESNFHRQIMYGASDLGKLKTIVAKEKLKLLNPLCDFNIHNIAIKDENAELILNGYDVVIDCTNNNNTHSIVIKTCAANNQMLVISALSKYEGFVSVISPKEAQTHKDFFISHKSVNVDEYGIIGTVPGLFGCIQANEALKILLNIGNTLTEKLLSFDVLNLTLEIKTL